jgi:hypothetical protein
MKTFKIAATVAALVAGPAAMAQITTPDNGPSDIFGIVWNANSTESGYGSTIVLDLGTGTNVGTFNYTTPQTWDIDTSLSQLETDLGTSTATDLDFAVVAASNKAATSGANGTPTGEAADFGFSGTAPAAAATASNDAVALDQYLDAYASDFVKGSDGLYRLVANATSTAGTAAEWAGTTTNPGNESTTYGNLFMTSAQAATLYAYENYFNSSSRSGISVTTANLSGTGTFTLNFASNQLDYNYTATTVPIPPALWLLLSGLVGVAAIGRRRVGVSGGLAV